MQCHDVAGGQCTTGFPEFQLTTRVEGRGEPGVNQTLLIPDMNFTCSGKFAAITYSGIDRGNDEEMDPKIQLWRGNFSQPGAYRKIGASISVHSHGNESSAVCADGAIQISSRTYLCILNEPFQVSVQPGDIFGLEIPSTDDDDFEILFTDGEPKNYNFSLQQDNKVTLQLENASQVQQLPQISVSITSGKLHAHINNIIYEYAIACIVLVTRSQIRVYKCMCGLTS